MYNLELALRKYSNGSGAAQDVDEISVFGNYAMRTEWCDSFAHNFLSK